MLRKFVFFGLAILIAVSSWAPKAAHAQSQSSDLVGVLERLTVLSAALDAKGYTVAYIGVDKLQEGQSLIYTRKLFAGNQYKIIGMGGVGVHDLDINLYDEDDHLIDKDTSTDNLPEVDVAPRWDGVFKIEPLLYSLQNGYAETASYFVVYLVAFKRL